MARRPDFSDLISADLLIVTQKILESSVQGRKCLSQIDTFWFKLKNMFWESFVIPGIGLHYIMRKRFIEETTTKAIDEGFAQVVNLGSGLDTLGLRLYQKYPKVNFLEVDYPATCVEKTKIITQVLAPLEAQANNLYFLPVDFNQKLWPEKMTEVQGFDPSKKTFFICEGVLMYLEEASVINLFSNLRTLTFEESKIIFTCVEPMKSKKNNVSFLLKLYLQLKGEPLCWTIEQEYLPDFLAVQGYKTQALINHEGFQDHYLKNHKYRGTLHQGEYIVIAEIL